MGFKLLRNVLVVFSAVAIGETAQYFYNLPPLTLAIGFGATAVVLGIGGALAIFGGKK
jgi:hypothetical protein